eukprot:11221318-Lingulodinium_polyedra.AAC.1
MLKTKHEKRQGVGSTKRGEGIRFQGRSKLQRRPNKPYIMKLPGKDTELLAAGVTRSRHARDA